MWISLGKALDLRCQVGSGNRGGSRIWSLDPPPLGERECVDFHWKSYGSEVPGGVLRKKRYRLTSSMEMLTHAAHATLKGYQIEIAPFCQERVTRTAGIVFSQTMDLLTALTNHMAGWLDIHKAVSD